ncbi:hypothetical protein [Bacillus alkalicellulosilyticus]|uniref:hypothetical protein n=1 Tax=Alkalihalobacterium alkalicellulosilyticum TaxID=1912214 RepID=UPI000996D3FE|nr:hypothetical protein [Bacillus alkalicellulosilyticus]
MSTYEKFFQDNLTILEYVNSLSLIAKLSEGCTTELEDLLCRLKTIADTNTSTTFLVKGIIREYNELRIYSKRLRTIEQRNERTKNEYSLSWTNEYHEIIVVGRAIVESLCEILYSLDDILEKMKNIYPTLEEQPSFDREEFHHIQLQIQYIKRTINQILSLRHSSK